MPEPLPPIVAVALNSAFDRMLEVPDLRIGGHLKGRLLSIQPAGKAANVARLLAALGTPSILTGFVGEGDRGRFERSFDGAPVRVEMFEVRGRTRENITLVDPKHGVETHIRDAGCSPAQDDIDRLTRRLGALATRGSYVLFAGSLPPAMTADALAAMIEVCRGKGAHVAVDSSGPGLEAVKRTSGLWLAKPNREELAEMEGRPIGSEEDIRLAAEGLRKRICNVIVTLGADGAYLFSPDGAWRARAPAEPRAVVKTVGSGDALLAGFVHGHASKMSPPECLRLGVACGTAACYQLRAGEVNPDDVKACMEKVELAAVK